MNSRRHFFASLFAAPLAALGWKRERRLYSMVRFAKDPQLQLRDGFHFYNDRLLTLEPPEMDWPPCTRCEAPTQIRYGVSLDERLCYACLVKRQHRQ